MGTLRIRDSEGSRNTPMTNTLNAINPTVLTQCFDWPPVGQRAIANVSRYLTEKRPLSIDGESGITEKLEQQLKLYFSCKYALLFNSGTSALHAAYFSINIPRGCRAMQEWAGVRPACLCFAGTFVNTKVSRVRGRRASHCFMFDRRDGPAGQSHNLAPCPPRAAFR